MRRTAFAPDDLAASALADRLPLMLLRRIPQTITNGYADALYAGHPHIRRRRRASDRYWSVQDHWATLGNDVAGVELVTADAPNGGGPYFALQCGNTLLTIHKADEEASAPRWAANRSMSAQRNVPFQLILAGFEPVIRRPVRLDVSDEQRLADIREAVVRRFDLYVMVTHCPDEEGDKPAFINALVVNQDNDVLAAVDLVALARQLTATEVVEVETVTISEPQQRRRRQNREASAQ